uniref:DUF4942 domain-containing protein n=1 Tax=Cupriavidus gilardii TaxID=82541 RepID=UPI0024789599|nr:DUF4942 domain-containing protein [Cupriavidus gilardii]WDE72700.1 hypothetical protein [Cupriavidus gilardii]
MNDNFSADVVAHDDPIHGQLDDSGGFFAPAETDALDGLLAQYRATRMLMEEMAGLMARGNYRQALEYFIEGNCDDRRYSATNLTTRMFDMEGGIKALNAHYWAKALNMTDVLQCMPAKRREEWSEQIAKRETPEFSDDNVRPTIARLLSSRHQFFAERIDGLFRRLSGEHVTNAPEGFRKRMIFNHVLCGFSYVRHEAAAHIHDLRCVVAKLMGRAEPQWRLTHNLLDSMRHETGNWVVLDGGSIRIRLYKKGTAHIEVHPDMAWRLNRILAFMHPLAIPPEFRQKPRKQPKAFATMRTPVPFDVLETLAAGRSNGDEYRFDYMAASKPTFARCCEILMSIGGVQQPNDKGLFRFDYPVGAVLSELIASGCLPEKKSHQFYATGADLAAEAADLADIGPNDTVLEPSAGQGALAVHLPVAQTICVELSRLHCEILRARGFNTIQADFIQWATSTERRFTRCVMNPPFANGRAQLHLQAAASVMAPAARIVAILPASLRGKNILPGWRMEWSEVRHNEFTDAGVSVVLLIAARG